MARAPRVLADGTEWVGKRVRLSRRGLPDSEGTVTRTSDGKHLAMWVRMDETDEEALCYATSLTKLGK